MNCIRMFLFGCVMFSCAVFAADVRMADEQQQEVPPFLRLSDDMIRQVVDHLHSSRDHRRMKRVCRRLFNVVDNKFLRLPDIVAQQVAEYLSSADVLHLSQSCRRMQDVFASRWRYDDSVRCPEILDCSDKSFGQIQKMAEQGCPSKLNFQDDNLNRNPALVEAFIQRIHRAGSAHLVGAFTRISFKHIPRNIQLLCNLQRVCASHLTDAELSLLTGVPSITGIIGGGRKLTAFPESMRNLTRVEELRIEMALNLSAHSLRNLAPLVNLVNLKIHECNLTSLPDIFGDMQCLKDVDLSQNKLHTQDLVRLAAAKHLERIDIWNNEIDRIPEEIGELSQLQELQIADNHLAHVPECLARCFAFKLLNLCKNPIVRTAPELRNLAQLDHVMVPEKARKLFDELWPHLSPSYGYGFGIFHFISPLKRDEQER